MQWRRLEEYGAVGRRVSLDHRRLNLTVGRHLNRGQLPARERSKESQEHVIGN